MDSTIIQIACGHHHILMLTDDGKLYVMGSSEYGQLGLGNKSSNAQPVCLQSIHGIPILQIACGAYHSSILTVSGNIFTFGRNEYVPIYFLCQIFTYTSFILHKQFYLFKFWPTRLGRYRNSNVSNECEKFESLKVVLHFLWRKFHFGVDSRMNVYLYRTLMSFGGKNFSKLCYIQRMVVFLRLVLACMANWVITTQATSICRVK
jgi:hypothetical protein